MDRQQAFERQIADEIEHEVGPPLPVDALAVTRRAMAPTPRWRNRTMFSTLTSAAGIGTAALLATTFLLAGQSSGERGVAPGAPADPTLVAAYVHGGPTTFGSCCGDEVETFDEEGNRLTLRNMEVTGEWSFDDPRLSGTVRTVQHTDEFPQADADGRIEIWWGDVRIENDDGAWSGTVTSTYDPDQPVEAGSGVYELTGEGAYEGLSALLFESSLPGLEPSPYVFGAIFPGDLPPRSLETGESSE
jgi:hypothetical protein